nr:RNA-directed DNA polymerase, eukaryota [Tanacetum cinerariifolium]
TWEPSFLTCKEKEYVSNDEFVRETSNNNDGQPPHDEVFGDVLSSDDEDNIDPKPQVDAPVEQSCEQVGSQTIKSCGSVLEIMEGIIQVGKSTGYTMEGCAQDLERIIGQQGESLVDIPMEGYAFTWSHPSASKMSKLDRF